MLVWRARSRKHDQLVVLLLANQTRIFVAFDIDPGAAKHCRLDALASSGRRL